MSYFTEGAAVDDASTLIQPAPEVGIDPGEAHSVLCGDRYADEVRAGERKARTLGIKAVPFFAVDE